MNSVVSMQLKENILLNVLEHRTKIKTSLSRSDLSSSQRLIIG